MSPEAQARMDDAAVDALAAQMKLKLAQKRAAGRGGWQDRELCPPGRLAEDLLAHLEKGDPVDVANYAAMIAARGERTIAPPVDRQVKQLQASVDSLARRCWAEMALQATHRCKVCGAKWIRHQTAGWTLASERDSWTLASEQCGPCCDNVAMGDQIEAIGVTAELECLRRDLADEKATASAARTELALVSGLLQSVRTIVGEKPA